jgi:hypothetical protein
MYICILFTLWHGHQVGLLTILVEWLYAHSINPLDLLVILKQWSEHNLIFRGYLNFEFECAQVQLHLVMLHWAIFLKYIFYFYISLFIIWGTRIILVL